MSHAPCLRDGDGAGGKNGAPDGANVL